MRSSTAMLLMLALAACRVSDTAGDHESLRALHERILDAHRRGDAAGWTALEADTILVGSRGNVLVSTRAERLERRRAYLAATRFAAYRDLAPPRIHVSADGTSGWVLAQVEVRGVTERPGAPRESFHDVWAWVELYEKRADGWVMVGNVSTDRPGTPADSARP